jgi:N-methylhydantoinase A
MAQAEAVEIVNFQVTAIGRIPKPATKRFDSATPAPRETQQDTSSKTRQAYFNAADAYDVPVLRRDNLQPGARIAGPAVIEEQTSTIVLYPGQRAVVDAYLNLEVEVQS